LLRQLSPVQIATLRPISRRQESPSLSVVIPARNERGNIQAAIERMPEMPGVDLEVIFVEGHSTDDTWDEIRRVIDQYEGDIEVRAFRQTGKGKADAVRLGFSEARGDLLTILDADLTMPPELLDRFYHAYRVGHGDFINGSRLVYPMEDEAMRSLNRAGNAFFAKILSWVLETRLGDTLCGTKLIARVDYERAVAWREDFGDFDPFGDFELLYPAAILGLGVVDVPIRYRERTYGETNISRFRHGLQLLRMAAVGLVKVRMGLFRPPVDGHVSGGDNPT
jgi:glycosyltransferase involved in cell wall biosynthesis